MPSNVRFWGQSGQSTGSDPMSAFDPKRRLVRDPGLSAGIWPNSASSRPRAEMARLSWRDVTANDGRGGIAQGGQTQRDAISSLFALVLSFFGRTMTSPVKKTNEIWSEVTRKGVVMSVRPRGLQRRRSRRRRRLHKHSRCRSHRPRDSKRRSLRPRNRSAKTAVSAVPFAG